MFGVVVIIILIICGITKFVNQEKTEYHIIKKAESSGTETYIDGKGRSRRTSDNRQYMVKKMPNGHTCWVDPYTNEVLKDITAINDVKRETNDMKGYAERKQKAIEKGERFFLYKGYNAYNRYIKQYPYEEVATGKRYVPHHGFMINVDTWECEMPCGKYASPYYVDPKQKEFLEKLRGIANMNVRDYRDKKTGEMKIPFEDADNAMLDMNTLEDVFEKKRRLR